MSRYQIKVNVSGSWANLCDCPPDRLDAVKGACEQLAGVLDHGIVFRVIDRQTEAVAFQFNNKPRTGEPRGWYVPYQPDGRYAPVATPNPHF
jgi:hypothetical protein